MNYMTIARHEEVQGGNLLTPRQAQLIAQAADAIKVLKADMTLHGAFKEDPVQFLTDHGFEADTLHPVLRQELHDRLTDLTGDSSTSCWTCQILLTTAIVVVGGIALLIVAVASGGAAAAAAAAIAAAAEGAIAISAAAATAAVGAAVSAGAAIPVSAGMAIFSLFIGRLCEAANCCKPGSDHDPEIDQWIGAEVLTEKQDGKTAVAESTSGISVASIGSVFYLASYNDEVQIWTYDIADTLGWQLLPAPQAGAVTSTSYCLGNANGTLYLFYLDEHGELLYMSTTDPTDASTWVSGSAVADGNPIQMGGRPATAYLGGKIYVAGLTDAGDGSVNIATFSDDSWSVSILTDVKGTKAASEFDVALCVYGGDLYCIYAGNGSNRHLRFTSTNGQSGWSQIQHINVHGDSKSSASGPVAVTFDDKMYMFSQRSGNVAWFTFDGSKWLGAQAVTVYGYDAKKDKAVKTNLATNLPIAAGSAACDEATAALQNRLFLSYVSSSTAHDGLVCWTIE